MEKIFLGTDIILNTINYKARIPVIYGNNNSNSITLIVENEDSTRVNTITFPLLAGQILSKNDYIDEKGINISGTTIDFTSEQLFAYEEMQNITLYGKYTRIYFTGSNAPTMKMYYYNLSEKDEKVYVLDKYEQLITVFDKEDDDTLINPRITKTQNSESIFTFSINLLNPKWEEISNPENLYLVDGMIFSTNFDGSFSETISENDEKIMQITAYERQKLLSRKYVRTWNSETNLEVIDIFMVVVLAKGDLPLKNNGEYVNSKHLPGTSGYVLDALLYGTDWKTGTCDVEGTFDLETDQEDIYSNILKVQEIWGGILVFDSVNKIVHHRDETKWLPYDGYEVKYKKNMQSLEKKYNNKIITRLYPFGESNLNIKTVNNNKEYIEDFSYTNTILEGIENNPDITDPDQLLRWGKRKLKDLCKPSKELTVSAVLLYQLEGYELETIDLNDIVDVIDYNDVEGQREQLRVTNFEYGIWDKTDAIIELKDITLDSTDIFKKTVSATNIINNGTLSSSKVISYYKNGQSVNDTIRQIDKTVIQTKNDLTKTDEEIKVAIQETKDGINTISNEVISHTTRLENLEITVNGLKNQVVTIGGDNLIRNSVGFFGQEFWEGTVVSYTDTDVKINNESDNAFMLQNDSLMQEIKNIKNGVYNVSFNYKKRKTLAELKVKIKDEIFDLNSEYWETFEKIITITDNYFRIEFISDTTNSCLISDLILVSGQTKQTWSQNSNETSTDTVSIGKGIQVDSSGSNTYTRIDADGNRTFNKITGEVVAEMTDKGAEIEELLVRGQAQINGLLIEKMSDQVWLTGIGG